MDWIALTCSITGIILNARKKIVCWPVWIVSCVFWVAYALTQPHIIWSLCLLNIGFCITNFYGWYCWKQDEKVFTDYPDEETPING